jgi:ABC-2 type transport system permease protein
VIGVELRKQLPRARTWVALLVMAVVPVIMTIGFAVGGPPHDHDNGLFALSTRSGLNMPVSALTLMQNFLLVIVVALFAGETVSGEASWGTLRYLLIRPVTRTRLLASKLAIVALLVVLATLLIPIFGLAAGLPAFGWHDVAVVNPQSQVTDGIPTFGLLDPASALWRLLAATGYVAWTMASTVAFAFLLSALIDSPFGAVFGGLAFAIVSQILDNIPSFGNVRYGLPTHYWHAWTQLFAPTLHVGDMVTGTLTQLPYVAVFLALAFAAFRRKDILT